MQKSRILITCLTLFALCAPCCLAATDTVWKPESGIPRYKVEWGSKRYGKPITPVEMQIEEAVKDMHTNMGLLLKLHGMTGGACTMGWSGPIAEALLSQPVSAVKLFHAAEQPMYSIDPIFFIEGDPKEIAAWLNEAVEVLESFCMTDIGEEKTRQDLLKSYKAGQVKMRELMSKP